MTLPSVLNDAYKYSNAFITIKGSTGINELRNKPCTMKLSSKAFTPIPLGNPVLRSICP